MNLKRLVGLDIRSDEYAYGVDPKAGFISLQRVPDAWVSTTCGYCSVGCGMFVGVKNGRAVSVRGNPNHPVNQGWLCPKGLSEHHTIAAPTRARHPFLTRHGRREQVSWPEAIRTMAARFRDVQARHGREAVGVISTGQLVTEEFYALGKLVQLGIGTRNFCGNTTLCMSTAVSGYKRSFGSDGPPGTYDDFEKADLILLIGANIADNHPILCRRMTGNADATVIVVDPRVTKTAMMADLHLPIRPRSDLALINGLLHIVLEHGLIDSVYIERHTTGIDDLRASVQSYTPERVAELTGLSVDLIYRTASLYANARAALIAWTMGVNHSTKGTETVNAINNLALVTGHIGRPGASPFSITGQCNAMGTREAGFTSSMPGYRPFEDESARQELAALWNVEVGRIPSARGLAYPDIIEAALARHIRALWIIGTNPVVSFPNLGVLRQALESLEFLVVQDGFHPTPTSEAAHLVLPAAIWGEKEGTYTNSERRVSKVNRAVSPPDEARPDFDIFLDLAAELGCRDELFPGWQTPEDAFNEWRIVSAGRLCDYSGMTYEEIERCGGIQWPYPEGGSGPFIPPGSTDPGLQFESGSRAAGRGLQTPANRTIDPAATRRLYTDGRFQTPDGRARLLAVDWAPFPEQPNPEFPLVLNTGRTVEHWHTRTKTGQVPILERLSPEAWVEMNPKDARSLGLKPRERVDVVSRRGKLASVELRLTETVAPGQIFVPFHYPEANANQLTQSAFDPMSREPNYKQSAVRVERATR